MARVARGHIDKRAREFAAALVPVLQLDGAPDSAGSLAPVVTGIFRSLVAPVANVHNRSGLSPQDLRYPALRHVMREKVARPQVRRRTGKDNLAAAHDICGPRHVENPADILIDDEHSHPARGH